MPSLPDHHEDLDEILELNRLFLRYLKQRVESHGTALDLARTVLPALRRASVGRLDAAAEFPRALFALRLEVCASWRLRDPGPIPSDTSFRALQLTLLHSAWNMARRSRYSARLFLGLSDSEVKRLRATQLGELHAAALGHEILGCALAAADWLWLGLLTETAPERRRQLRLLALQPTVEVAAVLPVQTGSSSR